MRDLNTLEFHPMIQRLTNILCQKTQNKNPVFFRLLLNYHLTKLASMMRVKVVSKDIGTIPINMYAINLSSSGNGKGYSTNIIEEKLTSIFKHLFFEEVYPVISETNLSKIALKRANINNTDPDEELAKVMTEFKQAGVLPYAFDSATTAAVKQLRHKLLMANVGSINLEIDECYLPDMEILTEVGFYKFKDLPKHLKVAQFDTTTEEISFIKPLRYIKKDYDDTVYQLQTPSGFDMTVTKNHEVLVWHKTKGYIKKIASKLNKNDLIQLILQINKNKPILKSLKSRLIKQSYHYKGLVYCVTVPTGAIVLRYKGKSFIGGNCGSNLLTNADVLSTFLELFDVGKVKQKLIKNTKENTRTEEIEGKTPTNLLLFGTPTKVLDGDKVENEFINFLITGYARRCFFGYSPTAIKQTNLTAEELYNLLVNNDTEQYLQDTAIHLGKLANTTNHKKLIIVPKEISITLIKYRLYCEKLASKLSEFQELQQAELTHRYFKALKLAGTYAFIDGASEISLENLYHAIKEAEESGKAFNQLMKRDKPYVKLAKYIAQAPSALTNVDLTENLSFYKGSIAQKNDLMQLATAWGYKNQIIIKHNTIHNIEFIEGETLQKTDLNKLILAYSRDLSYNYKNVEAPFNKLYKLTQTDNLHWINHHLQDGHRCSDSIVSKFNMIVLDIDKGTTINDIKVLLKPYKWLLHTTKRHTAKKHRFRLILPLNYNLKLNEEEYKHFMLNIENWLPFTIDTQTKQRARKWATYAHHYLYNKGSQLLDVMLFIPNTTKNQEQLKLIDKYQNLDNLERWFINTTNNGNRNNQLIKYAFILKDMKKPINEIRTKIFNLNDKLNIKLSEIEIENTILKTIAKP